MPRPRDGKKWLSMKARITKLCEVEYFRWSATFEYFVLLLHMECALRTTLEVYLLSIFRVAQARSAQKATVFRARTYEHSAALAPLLKPARVFDSLGLAPVSPSLAALISLPCCPWQCNIMCISHCFLPTMLATVTVNIKGPTNAAACGLETRFGGGPRVT